MWHGGSSFPQHALNSAEEAQSLNPWTIREVPNKINFKTILFKIIYDITECWIYVISSEDFPVKKKPARHPER